MRVVRHPVRGEHTGGAGRGPGEAEAGCEGKAERGVLGVKELRPRPTHLEMQPMGQFAAPPASSHLVLHFQSPVSYSVPSSFLTYRKLVW